MKSKASKVKNILSITVVCLVKLEVLLSWDVQIENYRHNDFKLLLVLKNEKIGKYSK